MGKARTLMERLLGGWQSVDEDPPQSPVERLLGTFTLETVAQNRAAASEVAQRGHTRLFQTQTLVESMTLPVEGENERVRFGALLQALQLDVVDPQLRQEFSSDQALLIPREVFLAQMVLPRGERLKIPIREMVAAFLTHQDDEQFRYAPAGLGALLMVGKTNPVLFLRSDIVIPGTEDRVPYAFALTSEEWERHESLRYRVSLEENPEELETANALTGRSPSDRTKRRSLICQPPGFPVEVGQTIFLFTRSQR